MGVPRIVMGGTKETMETNGILYIVGIYEDANLRNEITDMGVKLLF